MRPYSASATARAALVVIVVGLLVLAPAVGPLAHTARAAAGDDRTFAVAQGTSCFVVEPYEDDERNVTTFYDYRNPNSSLTGRPPASTYSSYGTEEFQGTSESALLFYAGPSGGSGPSGGADGSADGTESEQVGEPEANFTNVSASVNTEELVVGDTLVVTASVRNVGNASGTKTVEFEVDGVDVETRRFTLEPDESRTVRFTREFAEPGEYTVEIDRNERFRVRVEPKRPDISVTDLEASESTPTAGDTVTFTAVVHNDGRAAGERTLNLTLFGETVDSRTVRLRPNVSQRVEFTRRIAAEGEYTATVGNRSATVSVVAAETSTDETDTTATATSAPGFGVAIAVFALIVAAAAARRRGGG